MIKFSEPVSTDKLTAGLNPENNVDKTLVEHQPVRKPFQSLFSIQMELEDIFIEIEENGGEVDDDILAKLAITEENFKQKLNDYRKAYTALTYEADACKKEKTRLDGIIKVRENNAKRLKNAMYEAVVAYGDSGKYGNKVVNLIDSKLYTRKAEVCVLDDNTIRILKDLYLQILNELHDNDMLVATTDSQAIDVDGFIDSINALFKANYPQEAESLYNKTGSLFTITDLSLLKLNVSFETNALSLLNRNQIVIMDAYFDNEHIGTVVEDIKLIPIKNMIKDGNKVSYANLDYNESLIIK